jgi:hypothetical protein
MEQLLFRKSGSQRRPFPLSSSRSTPAGTQKIEVIGNGHSPFRGQHKFAILNTRQAAKAEEHQGAKTASD